MKKSITLITLVTLLPSCLWGCKKAATVSRTAYVIGLQNDIIPITSRDGGDGAAAIPQEALNAAVLIVTRISSGKAKFCSGALIADPIIANGQTRILTNHHCFAVPDETGKATTNLLDEACRETVVYFGFTQERAHDAFSLKCKPDTLQTSFKADVASFELASSPPDQYQPLALWDPDKDATDRNALIVHYPDIQEHLRSPKEGGAKLPTAAATIKDCRVIGPFPKQEWYLDRTLPFSLRHSCDLIHGSSGSPLIDLKTLAVLGINWGGIKISKGDKLRVDNAATHSRYLTAFLAGDTAKVHADAAKETADAKSLGASKQTAARDNKIAQRAYNCARGSGNHGGILLLLPIPMTLRRWLQWFGTSRNT